MLRLGLLLISIGLCTGCGMLNTYLAGADNALPPAELKSIDQPITIQKLWDSQVGSGTNGNFVKLTPALEVNRIYAAGRQGTVMALEADNGESIWEVDTELPISAGVGLGDGLVLVGTDEGEVVALHAKDGKEAWRAQVSSEVLATPRTAGGVVVVRTVDGKFIGLNARNGERLWVYVHTVPVLTLRGTAAPLLAQGVAITGLDTGRLLVLSLSNGVPLWEKTIAPPSGRTELDRLVDIDAEPRVVNDKLYVAAYQGNITAIDLRNGNTLWSRNFSSHTGLEVDNQQVYFADDNDAIWSLDRRTGGTLWKQTALTGRELITPVVSGNYVLVGDFEGYVHWLDKSNGKIVGRARADDESIGVAPLVRGDIAFVLSEGGKLSAFQVQG